MLTNPKEIEIISKARQKNVRDPNRSRVHFDRIFNDFLHATVLKDQYLLDLGPGQYDFGILAQACGARVLCLDNDPAVLDLGRYKGLSVREGYIQRLTLADFSERFDGIFCKFSYNAFWFLEDEASHRESVRVLCSLLQDNGWGWIAPWNGVPKHAGLSAARIEAILTTQADAFREHGFSAFNLTETLARYYGAHGTTANLALFVRNLAIPSSVMRRAF